MKLTDQMKDSLCYLIEHIEAGRRVDMRGRHVKCIKCPLDHYIKQKEGQVSINCHCGTKLHIFVRQGKPSLYSYESPKPLEAKGRPK